MLMSLTMRLRPTPPEDSWGTISVVAIPTPSFALSGRKFLPRSFESYFPDIFSGITSKLSGLKRRNIRLYGGPPNHVAANRPTDAGGTCFETGKTFAFRNHAAATKAPSGKTARCCGTYYIV